VVRPSLLGRDVELLAPAEPLAWAIDAAPSPGAPFRATWHAERRPGVKTIAADRVAHLEAPGDRFAVRVWRDDGSLSVAEHSP
jgi:hypothetical protein